MHAYRRSLVLLFSLAACVLAASGCDPKRTGGEDVAGPDPDETPAVVSEEAEAVAAILGLHMDMIKATLAVSADFDTTIVSPRPRSVFTVDCATVTVVDDVAPAYELSILDCVDHRGTVYRGLVDVADTDGIDGYRFVPDGDQATFIRGTNNTDPRFTHTYDSGDLTLTFARAGTGEVTGVVITRFIRHNIAGGIVTVSYDSVAWDGGHVASDGWPDNDQVVHIAWDGVAVFDITFAGSSTATFTMLGLPYVLNLDNGSVTLAL